MQIVKSISEWEGVCVSGREAEPIVSVKSLRDAISPDDVEGFRPLLPIGYDAVANSYKRVVAQLSTSDLTNHYTEGMAHFHSHFIPQLKNRLESLSLNNWDLSDYVGFAAGSDVDMMSHIVEAVSQKNQVALYPGDWFGFLVGSNNQENIHWTTQPDNKLACLCVPSVRNGHITTEMMTYLKASDACLLNLNLFPTLIENERTTVAKELNAVLPKSILSISFSRGFGMTASQLGVILVHKDHPYKRKYETAWNWYSYFYNKLAADTFLDIDLHQLRATDELRRTEVTSWLSDKNLPVVSSGTYYVKSFRVEEELPEYLKPLQRDNVVRLCFKPKHT